jgi:hypothetical protein
MPAVANIAFRTTFSITVLAALVACGSEGEAAGPYGDGGFPGLGFVGSGGRGSGYGSDGGASGNRDASAEGGASGQGRDGGDEGNEGGAGGPDASVHDAGEGTTGDGGSQVGVTFNLPPGFFPSLSWEISGPSGVYTGVVTFGAAQSLEFVVGGILAGNDYTIAIAGTDRDGMPCSGTSAPFDVLPGEVAGAGVLLTCTGGPIDASQPAPVITGSVGVDAAVTFGDL